MSIQAVQSFATEHLKTPVGEPVKGKKNMSRTELWLEKFYKKTTNLPEPFPHELVERLEKYLDVSHPWSDSSVWALFISFSNDVLSFVHIFLEWHVVLNVWITEPWRTACRSIFLAIWSSFRRCTLEQHRDLSELRLYPAVSYPASIFPTANWLMWCLFQIKKWWTDAVFGSVFCRLLLLLLGIFDKTEFLRRL